MKTFSIQKHIYDNQFIGSSRVHSIFDAPNYISLGLETNPITASVLKTNSARFTTTFFFIRTHFQFERSNFFNLVSKLLEIRASNILRFTVPSCFCFIFKQR